MRLRSALILATSAIPLILPSCAAALSWEGFADGNVTAEGGKESSTRDDAGGDTAATPDGPATDSPAQGPIAFVQRSHFTDPDNNNAASVGATFAEPQTQGNLVVVVVGWFRSAANITAITDTKGNTYAQAVERTHQPPVSGDAEDVLQSIWYAANIKAALANENRVTVTFSGGAGDANIRVLEYAGLDRNAPFDKGAFNKGYSGTATTPAVTPSKERALLVSAGTTWEYFQQAGPGFTERVRTADDSLVQERVVGTREAYTSSLPVLTQAGLPTTGEWVLQIAVFH